MVVYNYSGKEINAKIVYYGPALSGKTTNLEWIYSKIPLEYSGKMISLRTQTDRTIFFDFLPLELGLIDGFKTRFMLYTVPGQVYYNATRKMVLKGVDGVVFVADSEQGRMQDNVDSLQNLRENLVEIGLDLDTLPLVLQWNKRDLPNCMSPAEMEEQLNALSVPSFPASALTGEGVYETLHCISKMIYKRLTTGEQAAAHAITPGREEESSLFGQDIASRLKQVDLPAQEIAHEPLAVEPRAVREGARSDGAVLDAILGAVRTGGEPAMVPAGGPPSGATARATAAGHRPGMSQSVRPVAPAPSPSVSASHRAVRGGPAAAGSPPPGGAPRAHDEQELVSDLVDNVLSPMEGPAGRNRGAGHEVEIPGDDPLTYGSSYGRMVTLDGKDAAGRKPQGGPAPAAPGAATAPATPERGGPATAPAAAAPPPSPPTAPAPEISLELITDPRKLKSAAVRPEVAPALDSAQVSFADRMGGSKIIEVPITLDADAFGDGKSLRIVLNLKLAR